MVWRLSVLPPFLTPVFGRLSKIKSRPHPRRRFHGLGRAFQTLGNGFQDWGNDFAILGRGFQVFGNGSPRLRAVLNCFRTSVPVSKKRLPGLGKDFPISGSGFPSLRNRFPSLGNVFPNLGNCFVIPGNLCPMPGNGSVHLICWEMTKAKKIISFRTAAKQAGKRFARRSPSGANNSKCPENFQGQTAPSFFIHGRRFHKPKGVRAISPEIFAARGRPIAGAASNSAMCELNCRK